MDLSEYIKVTNWQNFFCKVPFVIQRPIIHLHGKEVGCLNILCPCSVLKSL